MLIVPYFTEGPGEVFGFHVEFEIEGVCDDLEFVVECVASFDFAVGFELGDFVEISVPFQALGDKAA